MELKDYQTEAVDDLCKHAKKLLLLNSNKKRIIFKSPTGSGKTLMMADFLKQLADDREVKPISCIWAAPRSLHEQSYNKLEKYYKSSRALECFYFEDLMDLKIGENEILFLNWESVRQKKNVIIRENERGFYFSKILENTKNEGRNIILIIDESHYHAETDSTQQLIINDIAPNLTVDVSATPKNEKNYDKHISVLLEDVKKAGMIKKSVVLNEGFENLLKGENIHSTLNQQTDMFVLEQALDKRQQLADAYETANIGVNPLLCVQLPDDTIAQDDKIREDVLRKLKNRNITTENGKLAIYLADNKKNLEGINEKNNNAEVMIFKQAIALGWDCPRAQILALFRDCRSVTFTVQTLGRIMRMPEPEIGHYEKEELNHAFVYTNLSKIVLDKAILNEDFHMHSAKRIDSYTPLKLYSVYRLRQREKTRFSPRFIELFLKVADSYNLTKKIKRRNQQVQTSFITDFEVENVDIIAREKIDGDITININNEHDLQKFFDYFARDNLSPYFPEKVSIDRVKYAIYNFFEERLKMMQHQNFSEIINIVLSEHNRPHFERVLVDTKEKYAAKTSERKESLQPIDPWEIPISKNYSNNYAVRNTAKSAMQPFYAANNESSIEKEFINFLENPNR